MNDMPNHPRLYRRGAVYWHRAAVPKDLRATYGKSEETRSLKTKDRQEALKLVRIEAARVDGLFQTHRERLASPSLDNLSDEQIQALAGAFFAAILREDEDERLKGFPNDLDFALYGSDVEAVEEIARKEYARGGRPEFVRDTFEDMTAALGVNWKLADEAPAWLKLTRAFLAETIKASEVRRKRNQGDVIETPPTSSLAKAAASISSYSGTPNVSFNGLFDLWKRDHRAEGRSEKTVSDMTSRVNDFIAYIGHDDAEAVTGKQVADYCEMLRHERGLSAKTVGTGYLASIRTVFRTGKAKFAVSKDPTEGVKFTVPKRTLERPKGFTDAEAAAILSFASDASKLPEGMSELNRLACRWIPWICAYSGARVGEIAQLRREDFIEEYGIPCIRITPEAGSVKTGVYRHVPLHAHLIEQGLLTLVKSRPAGHLFFIPVDRKLTRGRKQSEKVSATVGDFVRTVAKVTDERVWPNHGWRHRFKTTARDVGIEQRYMDVIQGHSDGSASSDYGENTMKALSREIEKLPRYRAAEGSSQRSPLIAALFAEHSS